MIGDVPPLGATPPTDFQRRARARGALAVRWLERSIEACGGAGSAAFSSRLFRFPGGWDHPYPETTGYLIPTLVAWARRTGEDRWRDLALRQADWVASLEGPGGWLPGGTLRPGRTPEPSVFNTGQMLFGLVTAWDETGRAEYLDVAHRAATWLAEGVDADAGIWVDHSYVAGFSPSYYARVAWPMLEVERRRPDPVVRDAAVRVLDTIADRQRDDGSVADWGFRPDRPAFTHTIAYTIRGLLESGRLLGADGERFVDVADRAATAVRRRADLRGAVAGTYGDGWRGDYRYRCVTGSCQLAIAWIRLAEARGDERYVSTAIKAVERSMADQRTRTLDPVVRGAIPGSAPRVGRYLFLRYPNWATKFFVDAVLADVHLDRLLEEGPCASP